MIRRFARTVRDSPVIRTAGVLTLLQVLRAGSAYLINLLSTATLEPSQRGILALILQLTYLGAILVVLGIERPFISHVSARFPTAIVGFSHMIVNGAWALTVPAVLACFFLYKREYSIAAMLFVMAVYLFLDALGKGVRVSSIVSGNMRPLIWFTVGTQGGMLVLAAVLYVAKVSEAWAWYSAYALTGLTSLAILMVARNVRVVREIPPKTRQQVRSEGLRLLPASFGNTAMVRSDRIILPILASTADLGIYVAVATIMEMGSWPISQWVDASLRRWATKRHRIMPRDIVLLTLRTGIVSLGLSVILGFVAAATVIWFLPPEYTLSLRLILPLGVATIIYALSRVQQGFLVALGMPSIVSMVEVIGMVASVLAYVALIPLLGSLGAAVGSVLGYLVLFFAGTVGTYYALRSHNASGEE